MVARKSRSSVASTASPARSSPRGTPAKKAAASRAKQSTRAEQASASEPSEPSEPPSEESSDDASEDAYEEPENDVVASEVEEEEEESEVDSDNLDEDEDITASGRKKRKGGHAKTVESKKRVKTQRDDGSAAEDRDEEEEDEDDGSEVELQEGQTLAMKIHSAPKTGHVPPGQISKNTMKFLKDLQDPKKNDRDWFKSHEPSYRLAEKEWVAFVDALIPRFRAIDPEIPAMPPKDLIHRIYRDVRFSPDKTPYKRNLSTSMSRGGRKGIWAGYFLSIKPNAGSIIAGGIWSPQKDELATFRHHIGQNPQGFRDVISEPEFVRLFGPAKPHPKGKRQNVFGNEDMLKVAPKGVNKDHKDIDLLRLRSIAVVHTFEDEDVLSPDFMDKVIDVARVMMPLVHLLNEYISLPSTNENE